MTHAKITSASEEESALLMNMLEMDICVNADTEPRGNIVTKVKAFLSHLQSLVLTLFHFRLTKIYWLLFLFHCD